MCVFLINVNHSVVKWFRSLHIDMTQKGEMAMTPRSVNALTVAATSRSLRSVMFARLEETGRFERLVCGNDL